ncbi:hypothetical protein AWB76_00911 [Caballeronia temeraria]|uniref:Uncharacterized protein n=2 Tax=Caballeronia temeraria TaxID=1777137 RepID=A0A157ZLU2_9BURK|nr:hypothetical protein AWB76_00911 [Caballeronia temeraria]
MLDGDVAGGTYGPNGNQPDWSQWNIQAALFDSDAENQIGSFTVTNLSDPTVPDTNGLYQITASAGDTAKWPVGKAQFWISAQGPNGVTITDQPFWMRLRANPLSKYGA